MPAFVGAAAAGLGSALGGITAGGVAAAGAAISAGTALAGALGGGSAQSGDISGGEAAANADEQNAYNLYSANEQPFITSGTNALSQIDDLTGLNGTDAENSAISSFQASPSYQYQLQQGLSAIDNGAASIGTLRSGNTIRAEETLGSNLANQDFSQYYNRLASLAGQGQTATSTLGGAGIQTGAGEASTATSGATAQSNIAGNTAAGIGKAVTGLTGNASVQNALAGIGSGPTSGAGNGSNVGVANVSNGLAAAPADVLG